ncbi:MAG: nuclear transport factor 2 family protein, partial [Nitrospiria bacterium]
MSRMQVSNSAISELGDKKFSSFCDVMSAFFRRAIRSNGAPLFLLLTLFLIEGCATDPRKPSPVSIQVTRLEEALLEVTGAYEQKDEERFFSKLDPSFHPLTRFKSQVVRDFNTFSRVDIQMTIERIQIAQESLLATVRWKGSWTANPDAPPLEKRGHALFRWTSKEDPLLLEIK